MTRLLGYTCNQPSRVIEALGSTREALVIQPPVSCWGLGYVQSGEVLLNRNPKRRTAALDLFELLPRYPSDYVIVHAADAGRPGGNANTQPFRFRRWMFAQTGGIDDMGAIQAELLEHMPGFLQRNVRGKTAAEHVFHLFLSLLHDTGSIDDADLAPAPARQALRCALALVYDAVTRHGVGHALGNIALTNGRSFFTVRLTEPMSMRRLTVVAPRTENDERFRGVFVINDNPESLGPGFETIPPQSLLTVSRDVRVDLVSLDA